MNSISTLMELFGTNEAVAEANDLRVGDFSCHIASGILRSLCWQKNEILRGLDVSIRDENWGTYAQDDVEEHWGEVDGTTKFVCKFTVAKRVLAGELSITLDPTGQLDAELVLTAHQRFFTNRAGFTLLHPLFGVSGTQLSVTHSDGKVQKARFPNQISPHQPFFDITGMTHRVGHVDVSIEFEGEIFEMEDHRNWTDASFKTYCRPLAKPFPYAIEAGETVRQAIKIVVKGHGAESAQKLTNSENVQVVRSEISNSVLPEILLASQQDWLPASADAKTLKAINADGFLIRLDEEFLQTSTWLNDVVDLANNTGTYFDVEIIVPTDASPQSYLRKIATLFDEHGVAPRHVIAVPQGYLKTISENGAKPSGASPVECINAAQAAFPKSVIGAGMLTNFTELNRSRPTPKPGDYITHGTSAIVHAADDISVFETLEALPQIFSTTKVFSADRPTRLGLMSIGMRSNPYGEKVALNAQNTRTAMAQNDPRQMGLFAAAFSIGVAACAAEAGCQALALAATAGPFGVSKDGKLFPLFHAVKALAALAGEEMVSLKNLPPHVYGLAAKKKETRIQAIFANCSLTDKLASFGEQMKSSCLDEASFASASSDPNWLSSSPKTSGATIFLKPCAVAFVEMEAVS